MRPTQTPGQRKNRPELSRTHQNQLAGEGLIGPPSPTDLRPCGLLSPMQGQGIGIQAQSRDR